MAEPNKRCVPFVAPVIQNNPFGWGPCEISDQFRDMPFHPFSKGDRLGKISDWTTAQHKKYANKYASQFGSGSQYAYYHEGDESTFHLVDRTREQKALFQRGHFRGKHRGGRGQVRGRRGQRGDACVQGGAMPMGSRGRAHDQKHEKRWVHRGVPLKIRDGLVAVENKEMHPRLAKLSLPAIKDGAIMNKNQNEDDFIPTKDHGNGLKSASLHIAQSFFGNIIGSRGATKNIIEYETNTKIKIPQRGYDGDIIISGSEVKNVLAAARMVKDIVAEARLKQRPTHFLSIPVNSDFMKQNFNQFKEEVCNLGVDPEYFTTQEKLHLSLLMLNLGDKEEEDIAKRFLDSAKTEIIDPLLSAITLNIRVKGIASMNNRPNAVHVLYAQMVEVDENNQGLLRRLRNELMNYFSKSGVLAKNYEDGKLHITLLNSAHKKDPKTNPEKLQKRWEKRQPFDATKIFEKLEHFDFGEQSLKEIHISLMSAVGPDGYYQSLAAVPI